MDKIYGSDLCVIMTNDKTNFYSLSRPEFLQKNKARIITNLRNVDDAIALLASELGMNLINIDRCQRQNVLFNTLPYICFVLIHIRIDQSLFMQTA